jgi:hypothetical protein
MSLLDSGSKEPQNESVEVPEDEEDHAGKKHVMDLLMRPIANIFVLPEPKAAGLVSLLSWRKYFSVQTFCFFLAISIHRRDWTWPSERGGSTAHPLPSKARRFSPKTESKTELVIQTSTSSASSPQ